MGALADAYRLRPKQIRLWLNNDDALQMTVRVVREQVFTELRCISSALEPVLLPGFAIFWGDTFEAKKIDFDNFAFVGISSDQKFLHFGTTFDGRTIPDAIASYIRGMGGEVEILPDGLTHDILVVHVPCDDFDQAMLLGEPMGDLAWHPIHSGREWKALHETMQTRRPRRSL